GSVVSRLVLGIPLGLDQTGPSRDRQHQDDEAERHPVGDLQPFRHQMVLVQRVDDQLDADEPEDDRQSDGQVDEFAHQGAEQEVQLPQPHQDEGVRREHQERVLGDAEDRRDRVDREQQVSATDGDDDHQHRGQVALAVDLHHRLDAVVLLGDREELPHPPHHGVFLVLLFFVLLAEHVDGAPQQETAEDEEDPNEAGDQRRTDEDEDTAHDQRQQDADQQHPVLVHGGDREAGHDHHEDEQVVHAQRVLGDVTREVLDREVRAAEEPHPDAEHQRAADVEDHPLRRFAGGHFVRLAVDDHQIEQQQHG